jgi:hypothetical protein
VSATPQGARSLAYWLKVVAPQLYLGVARLAAQNPVKLGGCGGGCGCANCGGGLGQDTTTDVALPDPTVDTSGGTFADATQTFAFDTVDPATFTPITVDQSAIPAPDLPPAPAADVNTPGVLDTVGTYLTTGGGLNALLNLGSSVLKAQAASSTASAAKYVLAAQVGRVSAGYNPAPIAYQVNPITGQAEPVLAAPGGYLPVTPPLLNTLAPNASTLQITSFLSQYGLWLGLGLVVILLARR